MTFDLATALSELVAADREYDAADLAFFNAIGLEENNSAAERSEAAIERREKALAAFDQITPVPKLVQVDRAYDVARLAFFGAKGEEIDVAEQRLNEAAARRVEVLSGMDGSA